MHEVKALLFDVFGTLVDWRSSIAKEAREILSPVGVAIDWNAFADAWRNQYQPAMDEVRTGRLPFSKLDALHRRNLDIILRDFDLRSWFCVRAHRAPTEAIDPGAATLIPSAASAARMRCTNWSACG
jgi:FMN phosphatase YigB (HAD superfamily)